MSRKFQPRNAVNLFKGIMMKRLFVLTLMSAMGLSEVVQAGAIIGVDYVKTDVDIDYANKSAEPTASVIRIGYEFNDWVSIEYRLGNGMSTDTAGETGAWLAADVEIEKFSGFYGRLSFPVNKTLHPYLIVGQTSGDASLKFTDGSKVSDDDSDTSMGFGVDFMVGESSAIRVEKINYIDKDAISVSATSVGYSYRF